MFLSPYLHTMVSQNGDLVVLHTLNSVIVKVKKEKSESLLKLLSSQNLTEQQQQIMSKMGFLVDQTKEELFDQLYDDYLNDKTYLHLVIMPTEKCNFRCVYCYENYEKPIMTDEVQESIIKYVSAAIKEYGGLRVEWFGGEPLIADQVIDHLSEEFKKICKIEKKPYLASMTTNAYFLNLEMFRKMFSKNQIVKYQITVDGLKENHNKQRMLIDGGPTFDTIIQNLLSIKNSIRSKFFNIVIRCNIMPDLADDFESYLKFIDKTFGDDERFEVLWKLAWKLGDEEKNCTFCDQNVLKNLLASKTDYNLRFGTNRIQLKKYGNICYASSKHSFVIGSDGSVYKCTVSFDNEKNQVGFLKNGKIILDDSKMKFWTERKKFLNYSECRDCDIYPSCMGIYCHLNNIDSEGQFVCNGMKEFVDLYLEHIIKYDYFVKDVSDLL